MINTRQFLRRVAIIALALACARGAAVAADHMHGGGYHHGFGDAERWAKVFDDPSRDAWQKPSQVIDALALDRAALVADIGAGTGYFAARIAKQVPGGRVFAADVEPDMVHYLHHRAMRDHLSNLVPVAASATSANLPEPVDWILLVDTYHHIDDRIAYFKRLKASLRPGGRLAIIDFRLDSPEGPPAAHRLSPEQVTQELASAGYTLTTTYDFLSRQYFLVFKPSGP